MASFSALLAICAGNSPVPCEFPAQRPVALSFAVFCDLLLNKRLSKQSWGWWFETLSHPLWRHRNAKLYYKFAYECVHWTRLILFIDWIHRYDDNDIHNLWHYGDVITPNRHSNHQPHDCLHNHLFRRRSKKTSKLRVTGLCGGNSPITGELPAQRASNAANVSIWWRHHG